MINKLFVFVAIAIIFASCNCPDSNENENSDSTNVASADKVSAIILKEFDVKAANFVDMQVSVSGIVDHVCKHGGKKIKLVADGADLHVSSENRFDDEIAGNEIVVTGIVREFRVDEAYCIQEEEDMIKQHSEGEANDEFLEHKKEEIAYYRDSMKVAGVDHLSYYSLDYVSHVVVE